MPSEYDQQLLESVAVRRERMVSALLFGGERLRRGYVDGVRRALVGVVLAALVSAGCVGYSFIRRAIAQAAAQQQSSTVGSQQSAPAGASSTPASPSSTQASTWAPSGTGGGR